MTSIIAKIVTDVENFGKEADGVWQKVETDVATDVAAVKKAFPAIAPEIDDLASQVKQGASDALGTAGAILGAAQPAIVTGANAAADSALLALTGGAATPAIPAFNNLIDGILNTGISTLQAWALKQKASIAASASAAQAATAAHIPS